LPNAFGAWLGGERRWLGEVWRLDDERRWMNGVLVGLGRPESVLALIECLTRHPRPLRCGLSKFSNKRMRMRQKMNDRSSNRIRQRSSISMAMAMAMLMVMVMLMLMSGAQKKSQKSL